VLSQRDILRFLVANVPLQVFAVIYWGLFDRALWEGLGATNGDGDIVEASKVWTLLLWRATSTSNRFTAVPNVLGDASVCDISYQDFGLAL